MLREFGSISIEPSFLEDRDDTVMAWLGMAGVCINCRGTVLLIDPLITLTEKDGHAFSETGLRLKVPLPIEAADVSRADVVMYTHAEDDHCGMETARVLEERLQPVFFAPPPVFERLDDVGIDGDRCVIARDFETQRFGDIEITITPALHDHDATNPWKRGTASAFSYARPTGPSGIREIPG